MALWFRVPMFYVLPTLLHLPCVTPIYCTTFPRFASRICSLLISPTCIVNKGQGTVQEAPSIRHPGQLEVTNSWLGGLSGMLILDRHKRRKECFLQPHKQDSGTEQPTFSAGEGFKNLFSSLFPPAVHSSQWVPAQRVTHDRAIEFSNFLSCPWPLLSSVSVFAFLVQPPLDSWTVCASWLQAIYLSFLFFSTLQWK